MPGYPIEIEASINIKKRSTKSGRVCSVRAKRAKSVRYRAVWGSHVELRGRRVRVLAVRGVLLVVRALLEARDAGQPVAVQLGQPHAQLALAPQPAHHGGLLAAPVELGRPAQPLREFPEHF